MSMQKLNSFGDYLRATRVAVGLGQKEAAIAIGYRNRYFLSRIENGRVSLPLEKIPLIAELYKIPLHELISAVIDEQTRITRFRIDQIVSNYAVVN